VRLKSYSANSMGQAMELVRKELGDDAIIVSSLKEPKGGQVRVTAAIDDPEDDKPFAAAADGGDGGHDLGSIILALNNHGAPAVIMDRLSDAAWGGNTCDPVMDLAASLDAVYAFAPLHQERELQPIMLVGPPGSGKTVMAAKLAARLVMRGQATRLVSADATRAGAVGQLDAFAQTLELKLHVAEDTPALAAIVAGRRTGEAVVIDTAGVNPYDAAAMEEIAETAVAVGAEPVLVFAAGADTLEATDIAYAFAGIGVSRLIATKLDAAYRLGGILAAALPPLRLSEVSLKPQIADGLSALTPVSLARLLLRRFEFPNTADSSTEGLS